MFLHHFTFVLLLHVGGDYMCAKKNTSELREALEMFKENIESELNTTKADAESKDLVESLAKQTFYILNDIIDSIQ